jgi:hypothetical protein
MTYFFCRVLIFKDHGKSAKEITCWIVWVQFRTCSSKNAY